MTSADDAAKAVMRAYADTLQPPPVADIIARAEQTRDAPDPPRARGRLVLVAASVAAAIAVAAIAADRLPHRGTTTTTAATPPTTSTAVARMAPLCAPAPPVLEGSPLVAKVTSSKPLAVRAGQELTLTSRIPTPDSHNPLLSFTIYLFPAGANTSFPANAVAYSRAMQLTPDQQSVTAVLSIPAGLAPGTYDVVGYSTWPGPSICGVPNPVDSTMVGTSVDGLGSIAVT